MLAQTNLTQTNLVQTNLVQDQSSSDQSNMTNLTDQSSSSQTDNEQPSLETVDTHLENCIQQIENDNTDEALNDCQNADNELDQINS